MAKRRSRGPIPKARSVPRPPLTRADVTRAEFNRIIDILNARNVILNALREGPERLEHAMDVQFHRIAQIQAELDEIKRVGEDEAVRLANRQTSAIACEHRTRRLGEPGEG
jgi:hypothetical protein